MVGVWWRSGGGVVEVWWRIGGIIAGERGGWFFDGSKIMSNNFDPI